MKEIIKTPGTTISYSTTDEVITFGDNDISLNLKNRQRDVDINIDICADINGSLVIGPTTGLSYVAQIKIPAKTYSILEVENQSTDTETTAEDGDDFDTPTTQRVASDFNIADCEITLWGRE